MVLVDDNWREETDEKPKGPRLAHQPGKSSKKFLNNATMILIVNLHSPTERKIISF